MWPFVPEDFPTGTKLRLDSQRQLTSLQVVGGLRILVVVVFWPDAPTEQLVGRVVPDLQIHGQLFTKQISQLPSGLPGS